MKSSFLSTVHTHTHLCDGKASPAEMAKAAYDLGFVSLGFSAHSPLPYENDWALPAENLSLYIETIHALKTAYRGKMDIGLGIELDADSEIDILPFEYTIGSLHTLHKNGESFPVDASPQLLKTCCERLFDTDFYKLMRYYYENLYAYVKHQPFTVLGHFDLPLKYNKNSCFIDETDPKYQALSLEALDGILDLRPDLIFEINTGGIPRAGRPYPYPSPLLLRRLQQRGARMTLTSDAHRPEGLNASYDTVTELLVNLDITELYRFENGSFVPFHLSKI